MAEKIQFDLEINSDDRNTQSIGEIREEFARLEEQLDETTKGTDEYYNTVQRLGQLSGELEQVDRQIEALNPDRKAQLLADSLSGLVGGFSAVTASVELFGVENEQVLQSIQKVNALLAVTEGINAFAEKLPAMRSMISSSPQLIRSLQGIKIGFQGLSAATKALGIGLVVTAVAALITHWDELSGLVTDIIPGLEDTGELFGQIQDGAIALGSAILQYLATPITALVSLIQGDFQGAKDAFVEGMNLIGNTTEKFDQRQAERGLQTTIDNLEKKLELEEAYGRDTTQIEEQIFQKKKQLYDEDSQEYEDLLREKELADARAFAREQQRLERESEKREQERQKELERERQHQQQIEQARQGVDTGEGDQTTEAGVPMEDMGIGGEMEGEEDEEQLIYVNGQLMTMSKFQLAQELGNISKLEALDAQLAITEEGTDEYLRLEKARGEASQKIAEAEADAKISQFQRVSGALQSFAALAGEQTVIGKALGIASATINTYTGATEALKLPFPANIAAFASTIGTGLSAVKQIVSTKVPSIQGQPMGTPASSPMGVSTRPIPQPTFQPQAMDTVGTVFNENQQDQRVYVTETDITETQRRVRVTEEGSVV